MEATSLRFCQSNISTFLIYPIVINGSVIPNFLSVSMKFQRKESRMIIENCDKYDIIIVFGLVIDIAEEIKT